MQCMLPAIQAPEIHAILRQEEGISPRTEYARGQRSRPGRPGRVGKDVKLVDHVVDGPIPPKIVNLRKEHSISTLAYRQQTAISH